MQLLNLKIDKIAIHQIFQRDVDGKKKTPLKSNKLVKFDQKALETFKTRVINALGSQSKAVQMTILKSDSDDVAPIIKKLNKADEIEFLELSYDIANKLADAQTRKRLPGGIVVVFKGSIGSKENRKALIGVMKAEIHSAYQKTENEITSEISLEYVEEALLTPSTKLFKTVGYFEKDKFALDKETNIEDLNNIFNVYISDSQISQTDGKAAAKYFYSEFLGCGYPESSARETKKFFEATCGFIDGLDASAEKKNDLRNALVSYLKLENSETVSATEFSERYFSVETRDLYIEYLDEKGLPNIAFTKDNEHIMSKLRMRKLAFSRNIKLSAPSDSFSELITINTISKNELGESVSWTNILIKDRIVHQE